MDAEQFDDLTRSLSTWSTRRSLVAGLTSGLLAALPLARSTNDVAARPCPPCRKKKKGTCQKKRPNGTPCGTCRVCQSGRCVNNDGVSCGAGGQICQGGGCTCPVGMTECGGVCVNTNTDPRNCGTCGTRCQLNGACIAGSCDCVPIACGIPDAACCPGPGGGCGCAPPAFIDPRTCTTVITCPSDTTPCVGPTCRACCPAGTTCDASTGTCLQ